MKNHPTQGRALLWQFLAAPPQRPSGIAEETNFASLADSSADIEARGPRFQMGVFVAPGATTFTRMLRGARSAAIERSMATTPPFVAAYAATPAWPSKRNEHRRRHASGLQPSSHRPRLPQRRHSSLDYYLAPDEFARNRAQMRA